MCLYVGEISDKEGRKLQRLIRYSKSPITSRRASVVLLSALGDRVPDIARTQFFSEEYVRRIIKNFNENGFSSLKPAYKGRTDVVFDEAIKAKIASIALSKPKTLGLPLNCWSLRTLQDYLIGHCIVDTISVERLRQILREKGLSPQRTKTWKESNDPKFHAKKKE